MQAEAAGHSQRTSPIIIECERGSRTIPLDTGGSSSWTKHRRPTIARALQTTAQQGRGLHGRPSSTAKDSHGPARIRPGSTSPRCTGRHLRKRSRSNGDGYVAGQTAKQSPPQAPCSPRTSGHRSPPEGSDGTARERPGRKAEREPQHAERTGNGDGLCVSP